MKYIVSVHVHVHVLHVYVYDWRVWLRWDNCVSANKLICCHQQPTSHYHWCQVHVGDHQQSIISGPGVTRLETEFLRACVSQIFQLVFRELLKTVQVQLKNEPGISSHFVKRNHTSIAVLLAAYSIEWSQYASMQVHVYIHVSLWKMKPLISF